MLSQRQLSKLIAGTPIEALRRQWSAVAAREAPEPPAKDIGWTAAKARVSPAAEAATRGAGAVAEETPVPAENIPGI